MSDTMLSGSAALLLALGAFTALLLAVLGLLLADRGRTRRDLASARAEVDSLRTRLEDLGAELERSRMTAAVTPAVSQTEFLITDVGGAASTDVPALPVAAYRSSDSMVKVVALGYGVRRALSPESRNRILFAMRREVKRARKERRRDLRLQRRSSQLRAGEEEAA